MPILSGPLIATGPLAGMAVVNVLIGVRPSRAQSLRRAGQPVPSPIQTQGLLDPGAGITVIDSTIIQSLGLTTAIAQRSIITPSTGSAQVSCNVFAVGLTLLHPASKPRFNLVLKSLPVLEAQLTAFAALGVQVLVGCDVLAHCEFAHHGTLRTFTLAY